MKVLLVDDDADLRAITTVALSQAGLEVVQADGAARAIRLFQREQPGLVLLDVNLPDGLGFDVCMRIRADSRVPIMMLTVRGEEEDIVRALNLGADDYLTKPFSPRILVTRVKALLRRAGLDAASPVPVPGVQLDTAALSVSVSGRPAVRLTRLEYSLLQMLLAHPGEPLHADRILAHVWGRSGGTDRQVLKQLVHRLRQKLDAAPDQGSFIENVPGVGYVLRVERLG